MTSSFTIRGKPSRRAGRTLREIVENDPGQVSEVWCRKIFRQLLQVLERQYAMRLPHRAITPDTVVFSDEGAALLPSLVSDPRPDIADDLTALARTVHFAITHETVPTGPLRGRAPAGYSDSLISAIDRSMGPDPARRPRSIGELRNILGIVATARPSPAPPAAVPRTHAPQVHGAASGVAQALPPLEPMPSGPMRPRHWAAVGGGVACLLLAAQAMFVQLRGPSLVDHVARPLPEPGAAARAPSDRTLQAAPLPVLPAPETTASHAAPPATDQADMAGAGARTATPAAPVAPTAATAPTVPAAPAVPGAEADDSAARTPAPRQRDAARQAAAAARATAPNPSASALSRMPAPSTVPTASTVPAPPGAAAAGAVFTVQIQPWGVLHVDGVERGISPPLKQLVLAPGRHSILVTNPGSRQRVLEVDAARGGGHIAVNFDNASP